MFFLRSCRASKSDELNIQVLEDVVRIDGEYKLDESNYLVRELPQRLVHADPAPAGPHRR